MLPAVADDEEYLRLPVGRRVIFALGGPLANVLLPVVLFAIANTARDGFSLAGLFVDPWVQTSVALGSSWPRFRWSSRIPTSFLAW